MTPSKLTQLCHALDLAFVSNPSCDAVLIPFTRGSRRFAMTLLLEEDGTFLHIISHDLDDETSGLSDAVLAKELLAINHRLRFLKVAIDPASGKVFATGEHWVVDSDLTTAQFARLLENFAAGLIYASDRLRTRRQTRLDADHRISGFWDRLDN